MVVEKGNSFSWKSLDRQGNQWFDAVFDPETLDIVETSDERTAQELKKILSAAIELGGNRNLFKDAHVSLSLEFGRNWGLGSSSTLINNISAWLMVDPLKVHFKVSNGSGYDIVAGNADGPLIYELTPDPEWFEVPFQPSFSNQLWFIHLGNKAKSSAAVDTYKEGSKPSEEYINSISSITDKILKCSEIYEFNELIIEHERILSSVLKIPPVKEQHFADYNGAIKSLGAWGGDFILATGQVEDVRYFKDRGYNTILSYEDLIL